MSYRVTIRFYEELNDFLERSQRKRDIDCTFGGRRSIKDLVESFGVPHVEVDLILVNGESVNFSYIVRDGDRISVYPVFERLNIKGVTRLRPMPLRQVRFVLDVHLRKLARHLRLLGFDVDYQAGRDDDELAEISARQSRILLSRDRQLLMRKIVERGLYVHSTDPEKQVLEVLDRLDIRDLCNPYSRCIECNGLMSSLDFTADREVLHVHIPPGVLEWCREYYRCGYCGRFYWKGSHFEKLERIVGKILGEPAARNAEEKDAPVNYSILDFIPGVMDRKIQNPYLQRVLDIVGNARREGADPLRRLLDRREELVTDFAFSIPYYEVLAVMARYGPIVEIGAGSGYWAWCLSQLGVDVTAIDRYPPGEGSPWELDAANRWYNDTWYFIEEGDERSAALYPRHTLLLSWPLLDDPMALGTLSAYRSAGGARIMFLGDAGLAGDGDFHHELQKYEVVERHSLCGWPGFNEELAVFALDRLRT